MIRNSHELARGQRTPVAVLRPRLPSAEEIQPFIKRIDESGVYSNYGPLWCEFRDQFGRWLGARAGTEGVHVVPTSSGTTAIEIALRARAISGRRFCIMPSFTFIASGHAVCNAGYEPFLVDIDERSFVITPAIAAAALRSMLESPAAVLVISAFGAPPDVPAWQAFEHDHGIPVIFDAAATIAHDCELEDFATLASGVALAGGVHLGSGVEIGTGARVAPRIRIDQDAVVGTGAMVIRPVPRAVTVPGVPARALRPDRRNSGLNPSVIDRKE